MVGLAIGLVVVFISRESFRFRSAISHVAIGSLIFILDSSFFIVGLLGDGWLIRETLTRAISRMIMRTRTKGEVEYLEGKLDNLKTARVIPGFDPSLFDNIEAIITIPVRVCQGEVKIKVRTSH